MIGWIKIDRSINGHWLWKDPIKFQWWIDMIMTVNFKDNKVLIGNQLIECKRGQSIMSLKQWADKWKVDKNKVRNFFVLLESDGQILHENLSKTTRITICNYESYQGVENAIKTQSKRNQNGNETQPNPIEEGEEGFDKDKEKKEIEILVFESFKKITGKAIRTFDDKSKGYLKARLKEGYTFDDIERAIENCFKDDYHVKENHKYLTLEFILRADKLSKYSSITLKDDKKELTEYVTYFSNAAGESTTTRKHYESMKTALEGGGYIFTEKKSEWR